MPSIFLSILSVYFFVVLGVAAKKSWPQEIHERSFILVSVYFLQPLFIFWGLLIKPVDWNLFLTPSIYVGILFVVLLGTSMAAKFLFTDRKEQAIATVAGIVGNTGNFGIPVGIAIFGAESVPYLAMINLFNSFFVYTFGVYFYSRGHFSVADALKNIFKLPLLWSTLIALMWNGLQIPVSEKLADMLQMGAYTAIVIQLFIFGMYLSTTKIQSLHYRLIVSVSLIKFVALPLVGMAILWCLDLPEIIVGTLLLQLSTPLAVNNINIAALYHCTPERVTQIVFVSSVGALIFVPIAMMFFQVVSP